MASTPSATPEVPDTLVSRVRPVAVTPGMVVTGRYKRPNRDFRQMTFEVADTLCRDRRPILFGTILTGDGAGRVCTIYADCFDPRGFTAAPVPEGTELPPSAEYWMVQQQTMYGYVERVDVEDTELAEYFDGVPLSTLAVDQVLVAAC